MGAGGAGTIDQRAGAIMADGVVLDRITPDRNYLFINVAAQHALQKELVADFSRKHMYLLDAAKGPLQYVLTKNGTWDGETGVRTLVKGMKRRAGPVKLCKSERTIIGREHQDWIARL